MLHTNTAQRASARRRQSACNHHSIDDDDDKNAVECYMTTRSDAARLAGRRANEAMINRWQSRLAVYTPPLTISLNPTHRTTVAGRRRHVAYGVVVVVLLFRRTANCVELHWYLVSSRDSELPSN